jgi:mRNA-degrading endonuclease toxin of MazEF toxin-antitoxin module
VTLEKERRHRRGEVRWYSFARPDRKRPAVILTRDSVLEYLGETTVAPITRIVRGSGLNADLATAGLRSSNGKPKARASSAFRDLRNR